MGFDLSSSDSQSNKLTRVKGNDREGIQFKQQSKSSWGGSEPSAKWYQSTPLLVCPARTKLLDL